MKWLNYCKKMSGTTPHGTSASLSSLKHQTSAQTGFMPHSLLGASCKTVSTMACLHTAGHDCNTRHQHSCVQFVSYVLCRSLWSLTTELLFVQDKIAPCPHNASSWNYLRGLLTLPGNQDTSLLTDAAAFCIQVGGCMMPDVCFAQPQTARHTCSPTAFVCASWSRLQKVRKIQQLRELIVCACTCCIICTSQILQASVGKTLSDSCVQ